MSSRRVEQKNTEIEGILSRGFYGTAPCRVVLIQQSIDAFVTERASKLEASSAALASMAKLKKSIELENQSLDKASNTLKDKQSSANVLQEQVKEIEKNREILKERLVNRQNQWRQANQSVESDQLEMEQSKKDTQELTKTLEGKIADAKRKPSC